MISVLNEQIAVMEDQVDAHFGRHLDAEILLSQPGLGKILGCLRPGRGAVCEAGG